MKLINYLKKKYANAKLILNITFTSFFGRSPYLTYRHVDECTQEQISWISVLPFSSACQKKILNARISYFRGVICKSWDEILLFEKYFLILTSEVIDIFIYGGKFLMKWCRCGWTKWARGSVKEKKTFTELLAQLKEFKFSIFWLSSIRSIPHVWLDLIMEGVYYGRGRK